MCLFFFFKQKTAYEIASCLVGSVRMGADDDAMSPLDARLRVKGVTGLRVADASVMPEHVTVNPNITCFMIGEKAAQLILADRA